jgi:carboxylesterase type B
MVLASFQETGECTNNLPAFGFLNAPELPLTERNLGFLDQRFALDWVQRNIHAFGGDPDKVTIFGESAGAASVDELVTSLPDKPPFRAAIMESGQTSFYINHNNSNHDSWNALVAGLNCSIVTDQLACVRAAPALAIKSIIEHEALLFAPVSDNVTQLEFPEAARIAGDIARVPILTGTNANEGRVFVYGQNDTAAYLAAFLKGVPQSLIDAIIAAYPIPSPYVGNAFEQLAQIYTEFTFQCPAARLANASLAAGIPTWRYYYNSTFANLQLVPDLGAFHSSEIPLVFGTYPVVNATTEEMRLSEYMQTAWATFAKNPMGGPSWQEVPEVGVLGSVGDGLRYDVAAGKLDVRCALYDAIYAAEGI